MLILKGVYGMFSAILDRQQNKYYIRDSLTFRIVKYLII